MIIVKLLGGLGNQLFQYAFGKKMALKYNSTLKFDLVFYQNNPSRRYELDCFNITASIASQQEIDELLQKNTIQLNKKFKLPFTSKPYYIHEKSLQFNPAYFKTQKEVYIDGYWQSEQYFIDQEKEIRKELQFKNHPSEANKAILKNVESCNAVSIHIRRGDFQSDEFANIHGICSLNYYHQAIEIIVSKITDIVFFVFSDDIIWAKENLKPIQQTHYADVNDETSGYEDLRLMAACKHHIIANSSFSWWGAWLNPDPQKMVIAPERWFKDEELNKQAANITPDGWIRI